MLHSENKLQETDRRLKLLLISALAMLAMTEGTSASPYPAMSR